MSVILAVPKERAPGERRVAVVPDVAARLVKQGFEVRLEAGAGAAAVIPDAAYETAGARLVSDSAKLYAGASIVARVRPPSAEEVELCPNGCIMIGFMEAHRRADVVDYLCTKRVTAFAMELIPRITRAQAMDALSSQGTAAGYEAALIAARASGRFFPMLTTAAGTIRPAKVLVLGAGVAGLQAIATARRLGAVVEAYDVRRAAREQVESLGAKFLQVELDAEAAGGYARELTEEEKEREQALLRRSVDEADVVISTAQVPGRAAPRIISAKMVEGMRPGAVIVDLAAESGGNCELTRPGEEFMHKGVLICGPTNVPSMLAYHTSEMYAKNIFNFLGLISADGVQVSLDWDDEILKASVLTHEGKLMRELGGR